MNTAGYAGEGTVLAIPSSWCFAVSIHVGDLPRNDRNAMLYRLEEKLPLAAEAVIADFIPHQPHEAQHEPQDALAVCVKIETIRPLIDALESAGVAVQSIAPTMFLAAQAIKGLASATRTILLCADDQADLRQISLIVFEDGKPRDWTVIPAKRADVKLALNLAYMETGNAPPIQAWNMDANLLAELSPEFCAILHRKNRMSG